MSQKNDILTRLERLCASIEPYLEHRTTQEVHVLGNGDVWWITAERERLDGHLPAETRDLLARYAATYFDQEINERTPELSAAPLRLFGAPWRITVSRPPISPRTEITLRRLQPEPLTLDSYVATRRLTRAAAERLLAALRSKAGILIAGGQRSGKTTFSTALLNAFLAEHPETIITVVEDTAETVLPGDRCIHYLYATPERCLGQLLTLALRKGSDLILLGEARDHEAVRTLFNALLSGHGGLTTFHAGTPEEALYRLCDLAGGGATPATVARALPLIVQLNETFVSEIASLAVTHHGAVEFDRLYTQGDPS